ncbi:MAG: TonB-dependent receptor, partial [Beijerinckiaceae bacterium]|nr:TonB-dependent receptor [Beijerinckiaceae bacterium]
MSSVSSRLRAAMLASAATFVASAASAQSAPSSLPAVTVEAPGPQRAAVARKPRQAVVGAARTVRRASLVATSLPGPLGQGTAASGSLTVQTAQQALKEIEQTPGGIAIVPNTEFKNGPANTVKDILGWVPGVLIQTRWGPDGRVSIRGS